MPRTFQTHACAFFLLITATVVHAGPFVPAGDVSLRHDIQRLSDAGVIRSTVTTWPLAWGPILSDIDNADPGSLSPNLLAALSRVRQRARWETAPDEFHLNTKAAIADDSRAIRSYDDTPRGRSEIEAGLSWIGDRFHFNLTAQIVDSQRDTQNFRMDDSMLGVALDNWSVSLSTMQRWWGPGWDSNLILSNNARPFPAVVIDRLFTDPPDVDFLRWIGPWDFNVIFGEMENDRVIPEAQFFGMRFNFRPTQSLEIGLTRTAMWCGSGRPCDLETFGNLLIGRDNRGGQGIGLDNEPGNQLAGIDFRWAPSTFGTQIALYGQFIGEDEAGNLPSRFLGQVGVEWTGQILENYSTRGFIEFASTSCQFHESSPLFDCAYEHILYSTGYRYRGASIGHSVDNDARLLSAGVFAVDERDRQWRGLLRVGELNRGGSKDGNTLAGEPTDLISVDLTHSRVYEFGVLEASIGLERREATRSSSANNEARFYLQWRSSY